MEEKIKELEAAIASIQERNTRVEADKAWETSIVRVLFITVVTYFVAAIILYANGASNYWKTAFVPAAGFFLSVQSMPFVKQWWIRTFFQKTK